MSLQRTPEWFAARLGKATGSRISDIVARTKSGYSTSRENYLYELVVERMTGRPYPNSYINAPMQWGLDHENGRAAYAFPRDCNVEECGFVDHPVIEFAGASPDGLVGAEGLVEVKCPDTKTHMKTLKAAAKYPGKGSGLLRTPIIDLGYVAQMQFQLACTGRAWVDFVSYDPRVPDEMQLFVHRVRRSDQAIAEIEREVIAFLQEVSAEEQLFRNYYLRSKVA
jgi:hypothetical protein